MLVTECRIRCSSGGKMDTNRRCSSGQRGVAKSGSPFKTICLVCCLSAQIQAVDRTHTAGLVAASHAVVLILSTSVDYHLLKYSEAANGILISGDGYLLTVSHGLTGSRPDVYVGDERYPGTVVYNDRTYDFAILKITADHPLPYVKFAGENAINQKVYLVGKRKRHRELFMSKGILSVKGINMSSSEISWIKTHIGEKKSVEYAINNGILHSAHFFSGLSGCPLLNEKGEVIGMNTGFIGREDQHITLAMELVCFLPVIESVMNHVSVGDGIFAPCGDNVDLENPVERISWVMNGLYHYTTLLGKDAGKLMEIRTEIEEKARFKLRSEKRPAREVIRWAWKAFLNESYAMK